MAISKVIYGDDTLIDITDSTIDSDNMLQGTVGYNSAGVRTVGSAVMPTVNDSTITIQENSNTVDTFTLNQSSNKTIDIPVNQSYYGTCTDNGDVVAKTVTISNQNFKLATGALISVKFSSANSASNVTLNVNGTGDKSIWYNGSIYTGASGNVCGYTDRITTYIYDGTYWVWQTTGVVIDSNTHRPINVNGTQLLGNNTTAVNFKNGTNTTVVGSGADIQINATDTTYTGTGLISISNANVISTTAEVNQNTFAKVKVGSTNIEADAKQDTLELAAGTNITLTPDATNDKVTITATDTTYTGTGLISVNASTHVISTTATANTGTVTSVTIKGTSPITSSSETAITGSGTVTLSHATSGATAGSYGDSSAQTPSYGGTFKVPYVTVNNTGHVTGISEHTVKIPASDNTDENVKQTNETSSTSWHRLLFSETADNNEHTEGAKKNTEILFQPSTGTLRTKRFKVENNDAYTVYPTVIDMSGRTATAATDGGQDIRVMQVLFKCDYDYDVTSGGTTTHYSGTKTHTTYPIAVIANSEDKDGYNSGVRLGSINGTTIVGAGESSSNYAKAKSVYNNENLYLTADGNIYFENGLSNDASTSKCYMELVADNTEDGLRLYNKNGVANTAKSMTIRVGNAINKTTAGNSYGILKLFSQQTQAVNITPADQTGSDKTIYLPNKNGTFALTSDIPTIPGVVSTSANGLAPKVTDTSKYLKGDGTWDTPTGTYSLPLAASGTRGGIKIGYSENGTNYAVKLSSEKAYVSVPWTDRYVNSATFADDTSANANNPVKMTLTRAGSDTATVTANIPKVSSSSAGVVPKGQVFPSTTGTVLNTGTTSFTQNLTSGTKVGTIKINGTSTDLYCQTNTDTKVTQTNTDDTSWHTLVFSKSNNTTTETDTLEKSRGLSYVNTPLGTKTSNGVSYLAIGTNIASGTADNYKGRLRLYDTNTYRTDIYTDTLTADRNLKIPNKVGAFETINGGISSAVLAIANSNLIRLPYAYESGTSNGITRTINADGSITVTGTATANTNIHIIAKEHHMILPPGTYFCSGCPMSGSTTTYFLQIMKSNSVTDPDGSTTNVARDVGSGITFTLSEETNIGIYFRVNSGYAIPSGMSLAVQPFLKRISDWIGEHDVPGKDDPVVPASFIICPKTSSEIKIVASSQVSSTTGYIVLPLYVSVSDITATSSSGSTAQRFRSGYYQSGTYGGEISILLWKNGNDINGAIEYFKINGEDATTKTVKSYYK